MPQLVSIAILLLAMASPAWADDHAQALLLANVSGIAPGVPFYVGMKFTIDPGWHIYWKNPGDSGLATDVKLNLPEGFSASGLLFPVPNRIEFPGPVVNYGYENEVMLLIRVTPPKQLPGNQSITLAGKASWLVCDKDNCIPGSADLSISLPVMDSPSPDKKPLFDRWLAKLPISATDAGAAVSVSHSSSSAIIDIQWKAVPSDIQFIPYPLKSGIISDISIETRKKNTKITFNYRNVAEGEPITGLVTFVPDHDDRAGFETAVKSPMSH
jgi:DsbC/DsbD-like thiol-disulfide interchange protein